MKAGAKRSRIEGEHAGALKISITAPPERGRANESVERLLSKALGIPLKAVRIVAGHTSPRKSVLIESLEPAQVRKRMLSSA